ncbi:MAG: NAD-dependent 4,6-dehydratase LegB [bacterium]
MKVLVTGAGGFIGSHLCEALVNEGGQVRALVRYNSQNSWGWLEYSPVKNEIEVVPGDIRDFDSVRKAVEGVKNIYHLAALISIPYSYQAQQAFVDVNIKGTLNLLQASLSAGVEKIVHTSTSEVYGTAQYVPIDEKHPINPQSPYAATKAGADYLALSFYRSFNLPVVILRPFNTYGPRQSARAVIPTIITQILSGQRKVKLGALHPTRDLTYVKDTVQGFIRAGQPGSDKAIGQVVNIGSNFEVSIENLAESIAELMGVEVELWSEEKRKRPDKSEVERLWAEDRKAKELLGWAPGYSLKQGLKETIDWLKENLHFYKPELYNV